MAGRLNAPQNNDLRAVSATNTMDLNTSLTSDTSELRKPEPPNTAMESAAKSSRAGNYVPPFDLERQIKLINIGETISEDVGFWGTDYALFIDEPTTVQITAKMTHPLQNTEVQMLKGDNRYVNSGTNDNYMVTREADERGESVRFSVAVEPDLYFVRVKSGDLLTSYPTDASLTIEDIGYDAMFENRRADYSGESCQTAIPLSLGSEVTVDYERNFQNSGRDKYFSVWSNEPQKYERTISSEDTYFARRSAYTSRGVSEFSWIEEKLPYTAYHYPSTTNESILPSPVGGIKRQCVRIRSFQTPAHITIQHTGKDTGYRKLNKSSLLKELGLSNEGGKANSWLVPVGLGAGGLAATAALAMYIRKSCKS